LTIDASIQNGGILFDMPSPMTYRVVMITLLLWASGCQMHEPVEPHSQAPATEPQYEAVQASALVFDPPAIQDEPELALGRADRQPYVVVGYEDLTAEYFSIRMDDRQINNGGFGHSHGRFGSTGAYDRYERRAVTERVGVRYR
jgi:hypothetical protein